MNWLFEVSYFFGGVFLSNAIPHLVSGIQGRPFQSPFATPMGVGLSSATLNVVWGFVNVVIGYLLVLQVGAFDITAIQHAAPLGLGGLANSLLLARMFGRVNGGNRPAAQQTT